jgi:hypothetical protein
MPFRAQDLNDLNHTRGVQIETRGPDGNPNLTTQVWIVVDRDQVFVRALASEPGNWYQEAKANSAVTIDDNGRRLEAVAIPVHDADSIRRANEAIAQKYAGEAGLDDMLATGVQNWTFRLDPLHADEAPLEAPAFIDSDFDSQLGPAVDMSSLDGNQKVDQRVLLNPQIPD